MIIYLYVYMCVCVCVFCCCCCYISLLKMEAFLVVLSLLTGPCFGTFLLLAALFCIHHSYSDCFRLVISTAIFLFISTIHHKLDAGFLGHTKQRAGSISFQPSVFAAAAAAAAAAVVVVVVVGFTFSR